MEIQTGGEKMRNASGQQGAASKVKISLPRRLLGELVFLPSPQTKECCSRLSRRLWGGTKHELP